MSNKFISAAAVVAEGGGWTDPASILDQCPFAVLVTDDAWQIRYANRAAGHEAGRPAAELLGEHLLVTAARLSKRDSGGELLRRLVRVIISPPQQTLLERVPVFIPERRFRSIRVQPCAAEDRGAGCLLIIADATREGERDEMKSEFVSVASHEMRTPMTSIKGSLELLLGGYAGELPAEATELLGISLTAVDRLVRLINDLLDISKIESGKMELKLDRMHVGECVSKSMRSLQALASAHRVALSAAAHSTIEIPPVIADRDRLEQVITNLLSNALKYSPPESSVQIELRVVDRMVRVSVVDHGPGIPTAQLERIFDRFFQLEGSKKGSGLGLAICRALIEQQHGRIWAESQPGCGAQFHFELPVAPGI